MKFIHGLLVLAMLACCVGTTWICLERGIGIQQLIEYSWDSFEHFFERGAEVPDAITKAVIYNTLHRTALPPRSGSAILQLIQVRSLYRCTEYASFYTDTLAVDIRKTGMFGSDWTVRNGYYSLWGCIMGRVPIQLDLSQVTANDVFIREDSTGLNISLLLPEPEIGLCEIDYATSDLRRVTDHGLNNEERARLSFELAYGMLEDASREMECDAEATGLLDAAKVSVAEDITELIQALYPDARVRVGFRSQQPQGEHFVQSSIDATNILPKN